MTQVMDGVRRVSVARIPMVFPKRRQMVVGEPVSSHQTMVVGMDGIRRQAPVSPRTVLLNMQASAVMAPSALFPAAEPTPELAANSKDASEQVSPLSAALTAAVADPAAFADAETVVPWRMPSLRLPAVDWRRPAAAFALVAVALAASTLAIRTIAPAKSATASADSTHPVRTAPSPKKAPAIVPVVKPGLQDLINNFVNANTPANWGIVVKDLKTGQTASYQASRQIESASLYKLFVAERIYQQIDLGQIKYSDDSGAGTGQNVGQCLTVMINISDNTCGRALGSILGWGQQNQALQAEGYKETDLATPQQTSAEDVARLFTRLYDGTLASPSSEQNFLGLLEDQRVNNRLPQGLPPGTVIAHKTGDLDDVVHDAGIVYGPKTNYLVVVTSGGWSALGTVPPMFANLSSQLWNYFEQ